MSALSPFICQSPEQRPAPSVYLCLHSAAPSALLSSSLASLHPFSSPLLHQHPSHPFQLCCILSLHAPAFAIFTLHHSCTTHPLSLSPLSLLSRSRIMALHWSNIMTFLVLSTSSASFFFFIKSTAPPQSSAPPFGLFVFTSILRHERVSLHVWPRHITKHLVPLFILPRLSLSVSSSFLSHFPLPVPSPSSLSRSIRHSIRL